MSFPSGGWRDNKGVNAGGQGPDLSQAAVLPMDLGQLGTEEALRSHISLTVGAKGLLRTERLAAVLQINLSQPGTEVALRSHIGIYR